MFCPHTARCVELPSRSRLARIAALIVVVWVLAPVNSIAQQNRHLSDARLLKMLDSLDRLLVANTRASATLVKLGQVELYSSNSFQSTDFQFDKDGNSANYQGRAHIFNSFLQVNIGVSKKRRVNVGLEGMYRRYRYDFQGDKDMFSILQNDTTTLQNFTYAGARVRVQPFRQLYNFTWHSFLWAPLGSKDKQQQLRTTKYVWGNTLFWYKYFNPSVGIMANASGMVMMPSASTPAEDNDTEFLYNFGVTLSVIPIRKNILFGIVSYSRSNKDIGTLFEGADTDFLEVGGGYQRTFSKRFFANVSYTTVALAHNFSKWNQLNVGVRYLF
ncbi:hypothetical protein WBG78_08015 [Chryseolinea sp. T2]|uniref:hypothetical protein n=1 Tax=Chryseolinea sp. T2 TaxID=3129255 RepID=UPI0030783416